MYLQLAEQPTRRRGRVAVSGYKRRSSVSSHQRRYPQLSEAEENPYIFVPDFEAGTGGVYIREDKFDSMPDAQYSHFMKMIAPYQPTVESGELSEPMFLASRASRKERRERKKEAKVQKKEAKTERKKQRTENKKMKAEAKAQKKKDSGEAKKMKAQAKMDKANNPDAKKFDWDKAADIGGKIVGKFGKGGGGGEEEETGGGGSGGGGSETPLYKNPVVIGVGILLLAGGIYLATKPAKAPAM
jgi:hypothetical protein